MDSGTHALLQAAGFDLIGQTRNDDPAKLVARAMPAEVRAMLSVEKIVGVTV